MASPVNCISLAPITITYEHVNSVHYPKRQVHLSGKHLLSFLTTLSLHWEKTPIPETSKTILIKFKALWEFYSNTYTITAEDIFYANSP